MAPNRSRLLWARLAQQLDRRRRWLYAHPRIRVTIILLVMTLLATVLIRSFANQWTALDGQALQVDWRWLAAASSVYLVSIVAQMFLWHDIMRETAAYDELRDNLTAYNLINLLRSLPGLIFHVTARTLYYTQSPRNLTGKIVLRATSVELLLIPVANLLCFAIVLILEQRWPLGLTVAAFGLLLATSIAAVVSVSRWQVIDTRRLGGWLLINCLLFLNGGFFLKALVNSVTSVTVAWLQLWHIWLLSSLISVVATYFLGGVSFLRELTLSSLLSTVIPPPAAIAVALWSRVIGFVGEIMWSAIILFVLQGRNAWSMMKQTMRSKSRES